MAAYCVFSGVEYEYLHIK